MAEYERKRGDHWTFRLAVTQPTVQDIIIEGSPTSGAWTADYGAFKTANIAHSANAATVQSTLLGLPNVNAGDMTVTGGPGPDTPWNVTIAADDPLDLIVAGSFSGGNNPHIRAQRQAFNLTGATIRVTFKANKALTDTDTGVFQYFWISGGASSGITVATPANGKAVLVVPASDTAQLQATKYFYDVQITDATGKTYTPDEGSVTVKEDVTRTTP